jgi:Raf kinase inhibitor-like YbhB/YbcL family protein
MVLTGAGLIYWAVSALVATLHVSSPAFSDGSSLPWEFTCYNALEPAPPISWSSGPNGTRTYVVVMDAPERPGGIGVQWLVFNVPADAADVSNGVLGSNDVGRLGYSAPCPPTNVRYRYRVSVYALDSALPLGQGASAADVMAAMDGHVLALGELNTTYLRPAWPWG